jgi:hypothetical protein
VFDHTLVVIGFSYDRGTELVLFNLGERGRLDHRGTYNLRSNDYYSGENYASRLIGSRLLLFTSVILPADADKLEWLPAMRRSQPAAAGAGFDRIATLNRTFMPAAPLGPYPTVHSLVSCDLAAAEFSCESTVLLGGYLSVYYASPTAGYAWTTDWSATGESERSVLYRIPFDGTAVSALQVTGTPPDQFAFLESADRHLNVVVAHPNDAATLLRVPLDAFADGSTAAPPSYYRSIAGDLGYGMTVRFVREYVLVGTVDEPSAKRAGRVIALRWRGTTAYSLALLHDASRIEAIGGDAVVVGTDEHDLQMTTIRLAGEPSIAGTLRQQNASESESRSHAFLYRADSDRSGLLGLPVTTIARDSSAEESSLMFIRNDDLHLTPAGALKGNSSESLEDHCLVSCTDWYGSERSVFWGDRIFGLLESEVIEGRLVDGTVAELRRLRFWPPGDSSPE